MRLTLFTAAALFAAAFAAVVQPPSAVGPLSPEKDPRTSLKESIRRMRLSIDRELVYLARMDEVKRHMNTHGMVARQALPADQETESTFHGFTDKVNDGSDLFRPIRPGVNVPSARQFESDPEPSDTPFDPVNSVEPDDGGDNTNGDRGVGGIGGGNGDDGGDGGDGGDDEDGPMPSEAPTTEAPTTGAPTTGTGPGIGDPDNGSPEPPVETPAVTETDLPVVPPGISPTVEDPVTETPVTETPVMETPVMETPTTETPASTPEPMETPETVPPTGGEPPGPIIPGAIGVPSITEEPTAEPTFDDILPSPTSEDDDDDDDVCFPAHATVQLEDGSIKKMSQVQLGDRVLVASGEYSEVFMFTHKMASVRHSFIEILTATGQRLALTKGHYLYVNDKLAAASTVRKGDMLTLGNNVVTTVENVESITSTGLYNPQTIHGDIIVNGVRASTYTLSVEPKTAHALLAPLRAVYDRIGFSLSAFDMGADYLASLVPSGSLVN